MKFALFMTRSRLSYVDLVIVFSCVWFVERYGWAGWLSIPPGAFLAAAIELLARERA